MRGEKDKGDKEQLFLDSRNSSFAHSLKEGVREAETKKEEKIRSSIGMMWPRGRGVN